jgi:hypothetical protein
MKAGAGDDVCKFKQRNLIHASETMLSAASRRSVERTASRNGIVTGSDVPLLTNSDLVRDPLSRERFHVGRCVVAVPGGFHSGAGDSGCVTPVSAHGRAVTVIGPLGLQQAPAAMRRLGPTAPACKKNMAEAISGDTASAIVVDRYRC